jgi:hypothetical protein
MKYLQKSSFLRIFFGAKTVSIVRAKGRSKLLARTPDEDTARYVQKWSQLFEACRDLLFDM